MTKIAHSRWLTTCRTAWLLTLGGIPNAIRFGARAPSYGAPVFRRCGGRGLPDSEITGFEPDPESYDLMRANIAANSLSNVVVQPGTGACDCPVTFYKGPLIPGSLRMSVVNQSDRCTEIPSMRVTPYVGERVDPLNRCTELLHTLKQNGFGYYLNGEFERHTQEIHEYFGARGTGVNTALPTRSEDQ